MHEALVIALYLDIVTQEVPVQGYFLRLDSDAYCGDTAAMDELPPAPDSIPAADWDATPARVRAFVVQLAARHPGPGSAAEPDQQNSSKQMCQFVYIYIPK